MAANVRCRVSLGRSHVHVACALQLHKASEKGVHTPQDAFVRDGDADTSTASSSFNLRLSRSSMLSNSFFMAPSILPSSDAADRETAGDTDNMQGQSEKGEQQQ